MKVLSKWIWFFATPKKSTKIAENAQIPNFGSISNNRKYFFCKKKYFPWVEMYPKFGIWAFSAIFALFFWVAKNQIHFDNTFNVYSYLKSSRKELSDGTQMLKKEYFWWVEMDPKFGIWAFSAIFALFFSGKKILFILTMPSMAIVIWNLHAKSFSLMLKKEYHLANWNCDWKSYTLPKKCLNGGFRVGNCVEKWS